MIIHQTQNNIMLMNSAQYINEKELQNIINEYPGLVMDENEPQIKSVFRELPLADAGILDVLAIDSEATLVLIEAKLASNPQSRREVAGQALDYVSMIRYFPLEDIDAATGGNITKVLYEFANSDDSEFEKLWETCKTKLKAGQLRVVVAIDDAPNGLIRIIRDLNDNSNYDIRLVNIVKYIDQNNNKSYNNQLLVHGKSEKPVLQAAKVNVELDMITNEYLKIADTEFNVTNRSSSLRKITNGLLPASIHYEIFPKKSEIGVELHIEIDDAINNYPNLVNCLSYYKPQFDNYPGSLRTDFDIVWDYGNKGWSRLRIVFDTSTPASVIAAAMKDLITNTKAQLKLEVKNYGL